MEVLRAESNEFLHLKNTDGQATNEHSSSTSSSSVSEIDDDDDQLSNVSVTDDKRTNHVEEKSKTPPEENSSSSTTTTTSTPLIGNRTNSTVDYTRHRERLAKELKDYEDRWLAHRNFLLYTQAFSMKAEDRERLFSQINAANTDEALARLSKEERDRFFPPALYNQPPPPPPPPNPYNFHQFPWPTPTTTDQSTPTAPAQQQQQQPRSPSSDDSGNQSNSGSTTEW